MEVHTCNQKTIDALLEKIQKLEEENKGLRIKLSAYTERHSDFMGQTSINAAGPIPETPGEK